MVSNGWQLQSSVVELRDDKHEVRAEVARVEAAMAAEDQGQEQEQGQNVAVAVAVEDAGSARAMRATICR